MAEINKHFSIISLDINSLTSPIKRYRMTKWIKKQNPTICCLQEIHLAGKDSYRLKVKGRKLIHPANGAPKQAVVFSYPTRHISSQNQSDNTKKVNLCW